MAKKITLGEQQFTVKAFTISELERITDIIRERNDKGQDGRISFDILRIALERAEPKVNPDDIEASLTDVKNAGTVLLELAGLKTDPPMGQETGEV